MDTKSLPLGLLRSIFITQDQDMKELTPSSNVKKTNSTAVIVTCFIVLSLTTFSLAIALFIKVNAMEGVVVATTGRRQTAELDAVWKVSQNTSAILNRILKYGDKVEICSVGVKDGRVADSQLSASSFHSDLYLPKYGRLDRPGSKFACWHAADCGKAGDWLQVYLPLATRVTGVVTQGRPDDIQDYITGYKVAYGDSADNMITIQTNGSDLIFEGNHDMHTHKTNMLPQPITARYFRIIVQSWSRCICMRMELLTC